MQHARSTAAGADNRLLSAQFDCGIGGAIRTKSGNDVSEGWPCEPAEAVPRTMASPAPPLPIIGRTEKVFDPFRDFICGCVFELIATQFQDSHRNRRKAVRMAGPQPRLSPSETAQEHSLLQPAAQPNRSCCECASVLAPVCQAWLPLYHAATRGVKQAAEKLLFPGSFCPRRASLVLLSLFCCLFSVVVLSLQSVLGGLQAHLGPSWPWPESESVSACAPDCKP